MLILYEVKLPSLYEFKFKLKTVNKECVYVCVYERVCGKVKLNGRKLKVVCSKLSRCIRIDVQ